MIKSDGGSSDMSAYSAGVADIFRQLTAPRSAFQKGLKMKFGERLRRAILNLGITQSEFARRCDLPRDSISTYVLGKTLPSPRSAAKMSKELGIDLASWLEESAPADTSSTAEIEPAFDIQSLSNTGKTRLRVNAIVRTRTALQIVELLEQDDASSGQP